MNYSKIEIGKSLIDELNNGYDVNRISKWAYKTSINLREKRTPEMNSILRSISIMSAGPEFELSEKELNEIAEKLILDGEKEELLTSNPEAKNIAEDLNDGWLLCPLCQEAWQSSSIYRMIICPNCTTNCLIQNSKLYTYLLK